MKITSMIKTNISKCNKIYKILTVGILLIVCILIIWGIKKPKGIQMKKVDSFVLEEEPIYWAFPKLSIKNEIPLGYEEAISVEEESEKLLSVRLENKTVKEILNALMQLDKNYYWEEKNGVINVMPINIKKDDTYILNTVIPRLIVNNKNREEIIEETLKLLRPNYKEKPLHLFKTESTPLADLFDLKPHNFKFKNKTPREILNAIVKTENISWIVMSVDDPEEGSGYLLIFIEAWP